MESHNTRKYPPAVVSQCRYIVPVERKMRRISINRTAIIVRYDCIPVPADIPAVSMMADTAGIIPRISPDHALSMSFSVHVSRNMAPAAFDPIGAA